ncbi:MAG: hypothetical protein SOV85_05010 [Clostridium sp.]|uniref:hypothetical protein n=1 Tax=Clostridium sp. TaxID=1506 RepID=UPI002A766C3A|nr:hypothetical protein [Clostridium sp.]MDY2630698.1 hypothetical protein [Clostridium sp.]
MKEWLLNTPVFITTFTRYETLEIVFNVIKEVRPRILFLAVDGPREGREDDKRDNERCKKILEDIDWECEVHRLYSNVNLGILENTMANFKKAFSLVDRLIFLEDDMLPTKSYFYFCEELLEKYKEDLRVQAIAGINLKEQWGNSGKDYFFSKKVISGACAFWKRTFDMMDMNHDFLLESSVVNLIPDKIKKLYLKRAKRDRKERLIDGKYKSFEVIQELQLHLQNTCIITPTKNLVVSIGVSAKAAHAVDDIRKMPKGVRKFFELKSFEYKFPLNHPKYIIIDTKYEKECRKFLAEGYPYLIFYRRIITLLLMIKYDGFRKTFEAAKAKLNIILSDKSDING